MKPELTLLIVANNCQWPSWTEKIGELQEWFAPVVSLRVDLKHTNWANVPFTDYSSTGGISGATGVDRDWYNQNITPLAVGYDMVMLVLPTSQWKLNNKARGWRTDRDDGPVELQVGADENEFLKWPNFAAMHSFYQIARHEICHALYMISGQWDNTHKYWDMGNLELALRDLDLSQHVVIKQKLRTISFLQRLLEKLKLKQPMPQEDKLTKFCLAIQKHEGYYPGSRSYRNNNPGNLKYVKQPEATGKDNDGFAIFPTYSFGFDALKKMVRNAATGKSQVYTPIMSIVAFFRKYAPAFDSNNPDHYAKVVADACGLSIFDPIKRLVE